MSQRHLFLSDGVRLRIDDPAGRGIPFVFQHGLCGDARQTAEVTPDLPGLRRITVECRGHGGSEPGPLANLSIATFADDIISFLTARRLKPIILGGISLGAAISLRIAVRRPDLVRALVLARPAWLTDAAPANQMPNIEVGKILSGRLPEVTAQFFAEGQTADQLKRNAPDNLNSLMGFFAREPREVTAALLSQIAADGPGVSSEDIRNIAVPVLVLGTERDIIHPFHYCKVLSGLIDKSRLVKITSKSDNKARYVEEFRGALAAFLGDFI